MGRKKINPRRIPIPKDSFSTDAVIEEAMKDDMLHAWLPVADALVNQEENKPCRSLHNSYGIR